MKHEDVAIVYAPTASALPVFLAAGGAALPGRLPVAPVAGDELAVGSEVFRIMARRIDPGPPARLILVLDHPSRTPGHR